LSFTVGELNAAINLDSKGFNRAVDEAETKFRGMGSRLRASIDSTASAIQPLAIGILGGGAALGAFAVKAIMASDEMERTKNAFTALLGSSKAAEVFYDQLKEFAKSTPFELEQLQGYAQQLVAVGVNSKQIVPDLKAAGDMVSALGGDPAKLGVLVDNMARVQSAGHVTGRALMEMSNAGIPIRSILEKAFHMTPDVLAKAVSGGKITADQFTKAFQKGTEGRFGGLMAKQMDTITGILSNLQDTIFQDAAKVGDALISGLGLKDKLKAIGPMLDALTKGFLGLNFEKLAPYAAVFGGVIAGILVPAFAALTISIGSAVLAAMPFLLIGAAIGGLAYLIATHWSQVSAALKPLTDAIMPKLHELFVKLQPSIQKIRDSLGPIAAEFGRAFKEWQPILSAVGGVLAKFMGGMFANFIDVLKVTIPAAIAIVIGAFKALGYAFDAVAAALRGDWGRAWKDLQDMGSIKIDLSGGTTQPSGAKAGASQPKPKPFDTGGLFTRPQVIQVAERRPEFVGALTDLMPLIRASVRAEMTQHGDSRRTSGSGQQITMNNYAPVNPRKLSRELALEWH
jgi:tape measure domain-containing protein